MFTCASHTSFKYTCTSAVPRSFRGKETHSFTILDVVGDGGDVDDRAQVLPRFEVVVRPVDKIELLHEGIIEVYPRDRQLCRALVPLKGLAEAVEVVVRGAVLAVRKP